MLWLSMKLWLSKDDGVTFDRARAVAVYNPGRHITGRGCPRTVQLDEDTVGTLFSDKRPQFFSKNRIVVALVQNNENLEYGCMAVSSDTTKSSNGCTSTGALSK